MIRICILFQKYNIKYWILYWIFIIFANFVDYFLRQDGVRKGTRRRRFFLLSWRLGGYMGVIIQITSIGVYIFIHETPITTPYWLPVKPTQPNPLNSISPTPSYHPQTPTLNKMFILNPKFQLINPPVNPKRNHQHNF